MKPSNCLTTAMAAQKLGFHQAHIRRLCAQGVIKAQKIGQDWIIPENSIKGLTRRRELSKPKEA